MLGECNCFVVKHACKDQKTYYENLLIYSRQHLMLYPYHLSDFMIRGLRVTPFAYYHNMMKDIMAQEKSYDALPNFTAADCKCYVMLIERTVCPGGRTLSVEVKVNHVGVTSIAILCF